MAEDLTSTGGAGGDPTGSAVEVPAPAAIVPIRRPGGRRRLIPLALVGVMSAGAAAAAVTGVVQNPQVPGAGLSAAQFVISSTRNTLSQHTADITFSGLIRRCWQDGAGPRDRRS